MNDPGVAVTGAGGGVGGRVTRLLLANGVAPRLIGRTPVAEFTGLDFRSAEYADEPAMRDALDGAGVLFFVSGREHVDRLEHHRHVVAGAQQAGVRKIVYTSFLGASPTATFTLARQHYHTERFIVEGGFDFVLLRDSMYADFLPYLAGKDDVIRGPARNGRASFVTRDDVAESAVAALLSNEFDGSTFDITGPQALSLTEVAALLSWITGRRIAYVPETVEEAYESRSIYGAPDWEVEGWVSSYQAIAAGEMETVSTAVETLTGHPPRSLEDFLRATLATKAGG